MLSKKSKGALENFIGRTKLLLSLIVLFGLALRLIFFSGVGTSDDLAYSRYSYSIDRGIEPNSIFMHSSRIGLLYPTFIFYKLFGVKDFSSVIFVLLTSLGNIILAYFFGKLIVNEKTGLMAAFLLAIFPLEVVNSTKLLTDIPSAFFMALGVYIFLYSEKKKASRFLYLLSGVFIGIGYMIRESTILIVLFFIIYVLFKKQIKKEYFFVPAGFIIILLIEILLFYKLTGNPLFKFTIVRDEFLKAHAYYDYFGRLSFPKGIFHYPYVILTNTLLSYFYILIFIAIAYFLANKKKEMYLFMMWFIPLLLYLSFGSVSFSQYIPFRADPRYLSITTIPGIVILAFFFLQRNKFIRKIVMPIGIVLLLITSVTASYFKKDNDAVDNLRELYPYLLSSKKMIYVDERSKWVLDYISGYNNSLNLTVYPDDLDNIRDSYIIINKAMINRLREADKRIKLPIEIDNPSKRWKIIKEVGKNDSEKAVVYYAP